jgi:hypothetical protein
MTTIASLLGRCQQYLQDETAQAWSSAQVGRQLQEEIQRLARQELFGVVTWVRGVAGTATYDLGDTNVGVAEVIYAGRSLRPVAELALTRLRRDWEKREGIPTYWTQELQAPNVLRIVPQPLATGLNTAVSPANPTSGPVDDNLVVFRWRMPQGVEADLQLNTNVLEDILVWRCVAALCGDPGEWQDSAKSATFKTLADLALEGLMGS